MLIPLRGRAKMIAGRGLELPLLAFTDPLPISLLKYQDLMRLCDKKAINRAFHQKYRNLKVKVSFPDTLPETDDEDVESECCSSYSRYVTFLRHSRFVYFLF